MADRAIVDRACFSFMNLGGCKIDHKTRLRDDNTRELRESYKVSPKRQLETLREAVPGGCLLMFLSELNLLWS